MSAVWQKVKAGHYVTDDLVNETERREGITRDQPPYWVLSVHSRYVMSTAGSRPRPKHFRTLGEVRKYVEEMT